MNYVVYTRLKISFLQIIHAHFLCNKNMCYNYNMPGSESSDCLVAYKLIGTSTTWYG